MLQGRTIVVAGATGQVGLPVALALAEHNEVIAPARFTGRRARARLEEAGVRCIVADLAVGDLGAVPAEVDHVLNFSVAKTGDWDADLTANAEGIGLLMAHCRGARSVLHCSTTGVYQDTGAEAYAETDPLGDNHRVSPFLPTYSIAKIAAEAVVRTCARLLDVPTVITRLNVPYGDNGGWPAIMLDMAIGGMATEVPAGGPARYAPIHTDDIAAMVPAMLDAASVPATIVNWGGPDVVSVQEWTTFLTGLTGVDIPLAESPTAIPSVVPDLTRQRALAGEAQVTWRDGFRRMVAARHPELLQG